ncbi:MAG: hypothetical protein JRN39_01625 [Nitrososphaerota archaeon]|nr:hypothetical protein [Nitrososphaerota archaeon]MDG6939085.1 hypothetical protein [Nitrososphaerota archaeon]
MEAAAEFPGRKEELERRIRELEEERDTLIRDITKLKERIENAALEKQVASMEREVDALRAERSALMEKAVVQSTEQATPQQPPAPAEPAHTEAPPFIEATSQP